MASPKRNVAYEFDIALVDTADTGAFKADPTIAAGDFKVSTDNGALANLATLPVVSPAGSIIVKVNLSAGEMNGNKILVQVIDAAGNEWDDVLIFIDATIVNVDDIVRSTTPANALDVNATGEAGLDLDNTSGTIVAAQIATDAITAAKIAAGAIGASELATDAVNEIVDQLWNEAKSEHVAAGSFGQEVQTHALTTDIPAMRGTDGAATPANVATELATYAGPTKAEMDTAHGLLTTPAQVNTEVDNALDTVIPGSPAGGSINERLKTMDDAYTAARAAKLDNLDQAITEILTSVMTESYAAKGATMTAAEALHEIRSLIVDFKVVDTTLTGRKLDGATTAVTCTLNDATDPTDRTRAT